MTQPNFLYHEFSCGCHTNDYDCRLKNRTEISCPIHHTHRVATWFTCLECGKPASTKGHYMYAEPSCRKAYRKRLALAKRKVKQTKKKHFDQSRRADCESGKACVDRQIYQGIKFNCYQCKDFKPKD